MSHIGDQVFVASVDAAPTQDSRVVNYGCCQRSGRSSLRGNEPHDVEPHVRGCGRGLGVIRGPILIAVMWRLTLRILPLH